MGRAVSDQSAACLAVYREDPSRVEQDTRIELEAAEGGYGRKQLFELIQNAADAMHSDPGPVHVVLTDKVLYVANAGAPFTTEGVKSLLASHLSRKSEEHIGQFGLGFKSVVAIAEQVSIFSRTGSFEFNAAWAASEIRHAGIHQARHPLLRLARPINAVAQADGDPILTSLMGPASTVIRIPLTKPGSHASLTADIERFPAPFLLFSKGVTELRLEDRSQNVSRTIRLERSGKHNYRLTDNSETSEWVVVSTRHTPSRAALIDAGELNRRESLELAWAAPRGSSMRLGEFWAFFPTNIKTTLSGIINAPWKLSADRLSMIEGEFNRELLTQILPGVVAQGVRLLHSPDDPTAMIDVLPARGKERRSWADDTINQPVIDAVAKTACLPNLLGAPTPPKALALHPPGLPQHWKDLWTTAAPTAWVHHDVDRSAERRLKAQRLITAGGGKDYQLPDWIKLVVADKSPKSSAAALALVRQIAENDREKRADVCSVPIVLLEDGRLTRPEKGRVFLRATGEDADHDYIHPSMVEIPGVLEDLAYFGIEVLNPVGELHAGLQKQPTAQAWGAVWPLIRSVGDTDQAFHILREELLAPLTQAVFAKVRSGKWRPLSDCLLPGHILSPDRPADNDFLVDDRYHHADLRLLERCGAVSAPGSYQGIPDEPWLKGYKEKYRDQYRAKARRPGLPDESIIVEGPAPLWPLEILSRVSEPAKAAMSKKVLELGTYEPWSVFHKNNSSVQNLSAPNPGAALLQRHGIIPTTLGPTRTEMCLHPKAQVDHDSFPVAEVSDGWAKALDLPLTLDHWETAHWLELIRHTEARNTDSLPAIYANAADWDVPAPTSIRAARTASTYTRAIPGEVAVSDSQAMHTSLLTAGVASFLVKEPWQRDVLIDKWGLADGREMLKEEPVAVPNGESSYLTDRFPPLKKYARDIRELDDLVLQPCSTIDLLISTPKGQETRRTTFHLDGLTLNVQDGTPSQMLNHISHALDVTLNIPRILEDMEQTKKNALKASILEESTCAGKLVRAVGADNLRERLPKPALEELEAATGAKLSGLELAELALAVHGYDVLRELKKELSRRGLEPPRHWAGSREARKFVAELGFDVEYAGFPGNRLDPTLAVDGPANLPALHNYQREVVGRIQALLTSKAPPTRGMVTLPTGAGKTRVASQAVIELVAVGALKGPVLWIGQTEELCEQAVQSWAHIWRALGNGPMTASRLWSSNEVDQAPPGVFQVVVATIDKLSHLIDSPQYDWLGTVNLIIVDEAHTSIASSYTRVFQWLSGEAKSTRMTTPLLGLTATAFRGHSESETERLVGRYQHNKLDSGVFGEASPYSYLQEHGVLAKVQQQTLEGMKISWTTEVGRHLEKFGTLPGDVEQLIGRNAERNKVIIESIRQQPDDWTILLFASSVDHARTMAAQLSYYGVPARPIDGNTDSALRRRYIEQFRAGEIRVLTNYNVLTQGFDAPKVRAVYVARPTFSPNLYQQMIGRGLRGPLNGGSDEVLIVNVQDNIQKYGEQLAFHHFDHLWKGDQ